MNHPWLRILAWVGAIAVTFVAAGLAWRNGQASRAAATVLAECRAKNEAAAERLRQVQRRRGALEEERREWATRVAAGGRGNGVAAKSGPTEIPTRPSERPKQGEFSGRIKETQDHPVVQNVDAVAQRERWRWDFAAFFRAQRFSSEQIERFLDSQAQVYLKLIDVETVARAEGLATADAAVVAVKERIESEYERDQREMLGEAGWRQWDEFRQTNLARNIAGGFGGMATLSGVPITTEQGEQLARIIAAATQRNDRGAIDTPCIIDWNRVDAESRAVLTEAQWALFRTAEAGGASRFAARLNEALLLASRSEAAATGAAAEPAAGRPGG